MNEITRTSAVAVSDGRRHFKAEPENVNDVEVEIWYNNSFVPAFLSDIKAGDYYLCQRMGSVGEGRCFFAASDVKRSYMTRNMYHSTRPDSKVCTYVIPRGAEIVTAPARQELKDVNQLTTDAKALPPASPKALGYQNQDIIDI